MKRLIKIIIVYENELEYHLEGLDNSICYDPENNELEFRNAGNGRIKFNTFYMKKIIINGKMVKGNVTCYC